MRADSGFIHYGDGRPGMPRDMVRFSITIAPGVPAWRNGDGETYLCLEACLDAHPLLRWRNRCRPAW